MIFDGNHMKSHQSVLLCCARTSISHWCFCYTHRSESVAAQCVLYINYSSVRRVRTHLRSTPWIACTHTNIHVAIYRRHSIQWMWRRSKRDRAHLGVCMNVSDCAATCMHDISQAYVWMCVLCTKIVYGLSLRCACGCVYGMCVCMCVCVYAEHSMRTVRRI